MNNFNAIDYVIIGLLTLSVVTGLMRGLVKEIIALLTWVVAYIAATLFATKLATIFTSSPKVQEAIATSGSDAAQNGEPSLLAIGASFICIIFAVLIIGKIIGYIVSGAIEGRGISVANRFLGGLFGACRGGLFVLFIMFLVQLTPAVEENSWQESRLVSAFQPAVKWLSEKVQPGFESLKSKLEAKAISGLKGDSLKNHFWAKSSV
jgi:membrane protein required for colicin V production